MTDRRAYFPVSAGLLTWKHYERLGPAWMVFLWMVHEQRKPGDGEQDTGAVRNGESIPYKAISESLEGIPAGTIRRHVALLQEAGYIRAESTGHGQRFWVRNPIRWRLTPGKSECADVSTESAHKCSHGVLTSEQGNKEQELRTARTKNKGADALFVLPDWIPVDTWTDFEEMRVKIRRGMTDAARRLTVSKLATLRAEGHDPRAVLEQSIQQSWQGVFPIKGAKANAGNKAEQRQADNLRAAAEAKRDCGVVN